MGWVGGTMNDILGFVQPYSVTLSRQRQVRMSSACSSGAWTDKHRETAMWRGCVCTPKDVNHRATFRILYAKSLSHIEQSFIFSADSHCMYLSHDYLCPVYDIRNISGWLIMLWTPISLYKSPFIRSTMYLRGASVLLRCHVSSAMMRNNHWTQGLNSEFPHNGHVLPLDRLSPICPLRVYHWLTINC